MEFGCAVDADCRLDGRHRSSRRRPVREGRDTREARPGHWEGDQSQHDSTVVVWLFRGLVFEALFSRLFYEASLPVCS